MQLCKALVLEGLHECCQKTHHTKEQDEFTKAKGEKRQNWTNCQLDKKRKFLAIILCIFFMCLT